MTSPSEQKERIAEAMERFKAGDLDGAEELFREFLHRYAESDLADNACYNIAKIHMRRNQTMKALEWLEYLLVHYPGSDAAYFAEDEKIELLRQLGKGPAETADECYFRGKMALKEKKTEEAERIFQELVEKYPDSDLVDNAHYNLAVICKQRGRFDQVRRHVDIIMTQYPDSDAAIYAPDLLEEA
ncbi:MAG TPA: tetratricopeptide repeat protein [Candidatus Ozemobacteraceae bacterium]